MKLTNCFLLFKLLYILASVHCYRNYDLHDISEVITSGIDVTINPCENFFDYACGKWIRNNELSIHTNSWDPDKMSEITAYSVIRDMLEEGIIEENNEELFMEKKFYDACMGFTDKEGIKLFQQMVFENAGSSWQHVVKYYASKIGEFFLFDIKLNKEKYFQIERARQSRSNLESRGDKRLINRLNLVSNLYNKASTIDSMEESVEFIRSVHDLVHNGEANIRDMTILELQQFYDESCPSATIDWLEMFQKLTENSVMNFENSDLIYIDVNYMTDLCHLLSRTSDNAIVNYLHYNFILDPKTFPFIAENTGTFSSLRNIKCIDNLPISHNIVGHLIEFHIPKKTKNIVIKIIESLKEALATEIKNSWLVSEVKKEVLIWAEKIDNKVSLRPDATKKKDISYDFEVGPIALQNHMNFKKAQRVKDLITFKTFQNQPSRRKRLAKTSACYYFKKHTVYISPTYLFPPIFDPSAPVAFNFGRLGFIIAHELSHAFDYGNMKRIFKCFPPNDTEEMRRILEEKKNCFVSEFNKFNIGSHTINENICDRQGISLAFKAMWNLINLNITFGSVNSLPNLESSDQKELFFMSFANKWCENPIVNDLGNDVHSPNKFRVLGTLSNMNEFVETYKCPKGTPMNSPSKCDLWSKPQSKLMSYISSLTNPFKKYLG